jgi:tRNA wybutosine-synthesizing protein 1
MLPTPEWALWGSSQAGFSPADIRFKKERRHHKSEAGDSASLASEPVAA